MNTATRMIRPACVVIFMGGIAGIIVSSVNGNNNGWVLLFGMTTVLGAIVLISVTAASQRPRLDVFDDALAERIEQRVQALVAQGADERDARGLVRDAVQMVRGQE